MIGDLAERRVAATFSDLDVWKGAYAISPDIHKTSLSFPQSEQFALSSQIRRASKSICANIAEGFAKQSVSKAEFKRYLQIALGSSNEMMVWVLYCKDLDYVSVDTAERWHQKYDQISRMLNSLYHKI